MFFCFLLPLFLSLTGFAQYCKWTNSHLSWMYGTVRTESGRFSPKCHCTSAHQLRDCKCVITYFREIIFRSVYIETRELSIKQTVFLTSLIMAFLFQINRGMVLDSWLGETRLIFLEVDFTIGCSEWTSVSMSCCMENANSTGNMCRYLTLRNSVGGIHFTIWIT